jgi:prevent-host-death family protein
METRPLAEVRQDLSKFVDAAVMTHVRLDITRNGKRAAVLLSAEDYDSLVETLDVLSDAELVTDIGAALAEADAGDLVSHVQVVADLAARRASAR